MHQVNLKRSSQRVIHKKSNNRLVFKIVRQLFLTLTFFLVTGTAYADPVIVNNPLEVRATVHINTIYPVPPPTPNPVPNNGVPLSPILSGTDSAVFKGVAYPGGTISVLKNGLVLHETPVFSDGSFAIPVRNIVPGTYTFSLIAKDSFGLKSSPVTYTIMIVSGIVTEVVGVIMPPTITSDKTEVKVGDAVIFSGKSIPNTEVTLTIFARTGVTRSVLVNASGTWSYTYTTINLDSGDYSVRARTKVATLYTLYSETILFTAGNKNTLRKKSEISLIGARCDLNNDSRVNLLDFSIMAYWYKRIGFPMKVDLNSDGRINLTDLSILAYCWTG